MASVFATLCSPRLSAQEQAYWRSVVVDGQWTQRRKYRAAKTLSSLCALCGSEKGSLIHRHFRCSEVPDGEASNMLGPFHAAAQSGAVWEHESFAARAATSRQRYTVLHETRWTGDRSPQEYSAATARPARGRTRTCAWQVGVWWSGTLPFLIQDVDVAELVGLFMVPAHCAHWLSTSRTAALLSKA